MDKDIFYLLVLICLSFTIAGYCIGFLLGYWRAEKDNANSQEIQTLEQIKNVINDVDSTKFDFGDSQSNNAFQCGLYSGGFMRIANIIKSVK